MRRLSGLALVAVLHAAISPLSAQDPFGTWQGMLATAAKPLRLVFDVERDNGRLKAVHFSIDQSGFQSPVAADTISIAPPALRIVFSRIRASFSGAINGRADTISGTWTQGGSATHWYSRGRQHKPLGGIPHRTPYDRSRSTRVSRSRYSIGVVLDVRSSSWPEPAILRTSSISLRRSLSDGITSLA